MYVIDSIKKQLHRDIVADPVLHARVLNLYLCGEAYPHTVDDYFPIEHVECPELAQMMSTHMREEDKHIALYAKAIEKLGEKVIDLPNECIFNHVIRAHTPEPWKVDERQSVDDKRDRVANFLAHAHWLEKRVEHSLHIHVEACAHASSSFPEKAVMAVLADESRHVRYTRAAVFDLMPTQRAQDILEAHRRAEARANLEFSSSQLRRLLKVEKEHWPRTRRAFYKACSLAMRGVMAYA